MHSDVRPYFRFTGKGRLDKAINSLLGLVEGISIDGTVNSSEIALLRIWLEDHQDVAQQHPFTELIPRIAAAVADGVLDPEERDDITWLCEKLRSTAFYDNVTADLQRLHALVGGIAADGRISVEELRGLSDWLAEHEHLKTCWPYDEIETLTTKVLADRRIDESEHRTLMAFFTEFTAVLDERTIVSPLVASSDGLTISALCSVSPNIIFRDSAFCFTGASTKYTRTGFEQIVEKLGGRSIAAVSPKLNFLVIGAEGNPCWSFACYGRKVEKAVDLRKKGVNIVLVHENDFHDAVLDA